MRICIIVILLLSMFSVSAKDVDLLDNSINYDSVTVRKFWEPIKKDTLFRVAEKDIQRKKHFWRAATEWFLIEATPATFNRFVRKDPYSYITFKNFINNQRIGAWKWDDNQFSTNQIDHPYHGQLYFNAFRSNGYNFYESSLATLAGSYIWETGGETQAPSINDLVNTTFGGIILGEMTHRVSRNILSRNKKGYKNIGNEIIALLVNPLNGLNRALDGKWGKSNEGYYLADSSQIHATFDLGMRRFDAEDNEIFETGKNSLYARIRFNYSNGEHNYKRPFDEFSVNIEVGNGDSTFVNAINVHALLYGSEFFKTKKGEHFGTLNAHYDAFNNDAFFYGGQSVMYNWNSRFKYKNDNRLNLSVGAGAVLLAAVPDPYLLFGDARNYNYGSGLSYRFRGDVSVLKRLLISGNYQGGYFHTISGNASYYLLHTASLDVSVRLYDRFSLNATSGYFVLESHYKDPQYADFTKKYPFGRISLAYNIMF